VFTRAVVITGAPGAGKSSVAESSPPFSRSRGSSSARWSLSSFGWGSPWLANDTVVRQLRAVLDLQRAAGRATFLIVATTETDEELVAIVDAIGADQVTTVLLCAPPDVVAARIDAREPDLWPGKPRLIAHARQLAATMPHLADLDIRVSTDGRDANQAASEVFDALQGRGLLP
jgi:chloramphenicol 3-O-phosphotransferase